MKAFKSGTYINQGTYKSFQPQKINRQWNIDDMEIISLLSQADRELGRLDMYSEYIPNIDLFIGMHVVKEATLSSKIEGTQTNIEEALQNKEDIKSEKRDDWEEVQNYISALNEAIKSLETLPFSSRLIKQTHTVLMRGVRGQNKMPGNYRTSQNWIGGASINDAVFVPPIHQTVGELMGDLENFAHNTDNPYPEILKIALIHYQFETIHPFLDGNGRIGRLLITLYLVEKGILKRPILYLSDFFERKRLLYYDNLMRVRMQNDIGQWFKFFLTGITETAQNGVKTFDNILKLQQELEERIKTLGARYSKAKLLLDYLFQNPIISASIAANKTGLSAPSAYKLIADFERFDILTEITGSKRKRVFSFSKYIALFK